MNKIMKTLIIYLVKNINITILREIGEQKWGMVVQER